jgi:hypothetical protein
MTSGRTAGWAPGGTGLGWHRVNTPFCILNFELYVTSLKLTLKSGLAIYPLTFKLTHQKGLEPRPFDRGDRKVTDLLPVTRQEPGEAGT